MTSQGAVNELGGPVVPGSYRHITFVIMLTLINYVNETELGLALSVDIYGRMNN